MDPEIEVVTPPAPQAPPPSLQERMAKSVAEAWPGATTDSATAPAPSAEVPAVEAPTGVVPAVVETTPPAAVAASQVDTPYTTEELRDQAFWGRLDKDGWAKVERLHPVETARVKAAQAAAARIVNAARKEVPAEVVPPTTPPAPEPDLAPDQQAILDAIELGTPQERFKAYQQLAALTVQSVPEIQATRASSKRAELMQQAHDIAVNGDESTGLPAFPELDGLDTDALNAAFESDAEAKVMASIGTPAAIALAMRRAGQTVLAKKQADTAKFAADQDKLRRNANNPPSNAVAPGAGGPIPTKPQTMAEYVASEYAKVAVRAAQ